MRAAFVLAGLVVLSSPVSAGGDEKAQAEPVLQQRGEASYYSDKFQGRKTATGERFDQEKLTAASRDLPLGTRATVTNEESGKSVDVKINDKGPYVGGRVIDLSKEAAERLDMKKEGVAPVTVEARPSSQPSEELKQAVKEKAKAQDRK